MAATGYTPIYLYYSSTATNQPSAGNLGYGELAINITDKNLFFKDNTNAVNTVPLRQSSGSSNGWLSSTDWTTFNNKGSGSVTSVGGTGSVSGITLSGTVTTSGNLTLGGTLTLASPPTIGNTTPNTGAFTTLSSTGVLSSTGTTDLTWNGGSASTAQVVVGTIGSASSLFVNTPSVNGSYGSGLGVNGTYGTPSARSVIQLHALGTKSGGPYGSDMAFFTTANTSETEVMRLFSSTGVSIGNTTDPGAGNLRFNTTGSNGIYFGASSQLNDYEEGTWTPVFVPQTGSFTSITMVVNSATYIKVGKLVTVQAYILTNGLNVTGASGSLYISGLPFANQYGSVPGSIAFSFNWGANKPNYICTLATGGTKIELLRSDTSTDVNVTDMTTGAGVNNFISLSLTYRVS